MSVQRLLLCPLRGCTLDRDFLFNIMPFIKGHQLSSVSREKLSNTLKQQFKEGRKVWNKGIPCSKETKRKISETEKGKFIPENIREKMKLSHLGKNIGKDNPNWKGDKVGYSGLHLWVQCQLGKPTKCEHCGKDGLSGRNIHWANINRKYSRKLSEWKRLCASCHKINDLKIITSCQ